MVPDVTHEFFEFNNHEIESDYRNVEVPEIEDPNENAIECSRIEENSSCVVSLQNGTL